MDGSDFGFHVLLFVMARGSTRTRIIDA
jgi:hypothetical protein